MTAAVLAQRGRDAGSVLQLRAELDAAVVVLGGAARHAALETLRDGGLRTLAAHWHLPEKDTLVAEACLRTVIGPPVVFGAAALPTLHDFCDSGPESTFALAPLLFGEALAAGWPWALAMRLFSGLRRGRACDGGHGFIP